MKRGDIVKQRIHRGGRYDFFHVERIYSNGALDVIDDDNGQMIGLSGHRCEPATLRELVDHREWLAARRAR